MKAIKIDPIEKTITHIDLKMDPNESFKELYEIIGCDMVEFVDIGHDLQLIVDEEGRCKDIKGAFEFIGGGEPIAGIALVMEDDMGALGSIHMPISYIEKIVQWVDPEDVPEPEILVYEF